MSPAEPVPGAGRLAAFLRGINLGGRRVTNDELREPFRALGLEGVAPYRASGNVVFDDPGADRSELERSIERALADAFGFEAAAFVRPLQRLGSVVRLDLLADAREEGFTPHLVFLREPPAAEAREALSGLESEEDRFVVLEAEVAWLRRGRLSHSPIRIRHLEAALGGPEHTMRNLNTLERMVDKFG